MHENRDCTGVDQLLAIVIYLVSLVCQLKKVIPEWVIFNNAPVALR